METSDFNLLYLLLTCVLVLISFLTIIVSLLMSFKSDLIATEANKHAKQANEISKQAFEIAIFGFREDVTPELVGEIRWHLTKSEPFFQIYFILRNKSRGVAIIESVKTNNDNFSLEEISREGRIKMSGKESIEIKYNRIFMYKIKFKTDQNSPDLRILPNDQVKLYLSNNFFIHILNTTFNIKFSDQIGTCYWCHLEKDEKDNLFKGEPMEFEKHLFDSL